jgi:hypothetical protein
MGPLCFDRGYGPFRWVCCSLEPGDLAMTDEVAMSCIDPERCWQDRDNYNWVRDARRNNLVVGSQARILYADAEGRVRIALAFNDLVRRGTIGPVIIGRDHHDVSGTDSLTANQQHPGWVNVMADMAFTVGPATPPWHDAGRGFEWRGSQRRRSTRDSAVLTVPPGGRDHPVRRRLGRRGRARRAAQRGGLETAAA